MSPRNRMGPSVAVALGVLSIILSAQSPRHVNFTDDDAFLLCARDVFRKPVFRNTAVGYPGNDIGCPASREQLITRLEAGKFAVFDSANVVYVVPVRVLKPPFEVLWKSLRLVDEVRPWHSPFTSRVLSQAELQSVTDEVFRTARPVAMIHPLDPEPGTTVGLLTRSVRVDVHQFGDREHIVAILGSERDSPAIRVVFGRLASGRFEILWDSPAFPGWRFQLGYSDLDRDGIDEILLASELDAGGGTIFSALTVKGEEITRQQPCFVNELWGFDERGGVCPIIGDGVDIDGAVSGPKQLVVTNPLPQRNSPREGRFRYRLLDGRYQSIVPLMLAPGK